jgi:hypothetical protein
LEAHWQGKPNYICVNGKWERIVYK